ncbi:hypothetical protein Patl1_06996 [Pistacia atlantica]|uniref:Uncharacterized protein n=1 Tax=Pistacia atlantica TaxID=434234 RepID=A0ACC1AIM0_9ROSI|nr:hypothetical protein Patl1_06996 [Pistacia atlantica]
MQLIFVTVSKGRDILYTKRVTLLPDNPENKRQDPCSLMKQLPLSASEDSFKKIVMQHMMCGFGDYPNVTTSKNFDTCGGHSCGICHRFEADKAQDIGSKRGKLSVEDLQYLIRKQDLPKLNR